ncbi:MAG: hypothetical protein LBH29_00575 [Elusimicrobiota bacterium]|jgi:hypothetical protein|nr:hypothetical protein [Elusimicrobiota bacterium]
MSDASFLKALSESFQRYLIFGARSPEKLKPLHSFISKTIADKLSAGTGNNNNYEIYSLGFGNGNEKTICGRYFDKRVDIAVLSNGEPKVATGIKFVMSNYKQNSNNYFENMLGETANIRSNKIAYFQICILIEQIPYYDSRDKITHFEEITERNLKKYIVLSSDNSDIFLHSPTKTLLYIVKLPDADKELTDSKDYSQYYKNAHLVLSNSFNQNSFKSGIILNDFEMFVDKMIYYIRSI